MLYHGYDQAGLDAQYNMRQAVPEFPDFVARWAAASAATRSRVPCQLDLAYGDHDRERVDLFRCGRPGAPLHVFIHGGYWQAMDKEHFSYVADGLVPKGFDVAVLDYALAPEVSVAEIVAQCRRALAWLWREAPRFGYDADNITVSGHSAGGHLTAMLALTDWTALNDGLPRRLLRGGFAISGLYDLEPIRLSYLNEALGLDEAAAADVSPLRLLASAPEPPPLWAAVGGDETPEFHRQQAEFLQAWKSRGWSAQAVAMPDSNHFSVVDALGDADSTLAVAIARLAESA